MAYSRLRRRRLRLKYRFQRARKRQHGATHPPQMGLIDRIHDRDGQTIRMLPVLHHPIADVILQSYPTAMETAIVIVSVVIGLLLTPHADLVHEAILNHRCLANGFKEGKTMVTYINRKVGEIKMIRRMTRNLQQRKTANAGFIQSIRLIYLT